MKQKVELVEQLTGVTREWGRMNLAMDPMSVLPILWSSTPGTRK